MTTHSLTVAKQSFVCRHCRQKINPGGKYRTLIGSKYHSPNCVGFLLSRRSLLDLTPTRQEVAAAERSWDALCTDLDIFVGPLVLS